MTAIPTPHADFIVDRRRLRRKVTFWRVLAFLLAVATIAAIWWQATRSNAPGPNEPHIARVRISGLITGDRATMELLDKIGKSQARAVLLSIESPGGTTTGSEKLYEELRRLNTRKPVVAVVGTVAASGAYIAALGADHIVAHQNSLVGSIGVLMQLPNVARMLDHIGVKVETVRSSPLKAAPNGLEPTSEEARQAVAAIVADSYAWFKDLVRERRKLGPDELAKVVDGRVFTGRQSVSLKLIDALGGERAAIEWLEKERKISSKLRVRDWKKSSSLRFSGLTTAAALADMAGLPQVAAAIRRTGTPLELQSLDGLLAVWQGWDIR